MFVNHKEKVLFVHNQKTAGHAIIAALELERLNNRRHDKLKDLSNPEKYKDYFIFTCVRHPFDKVLSHYFYHKNGKKPAIAKNMNDFIRAFLERNKQYDRIKHPFLKCHVIKYEELPDSFNNMCEKQNIKHKSLEVNYFLRNYDRWEHITRDYLKAISDKCKEDFKRFNYKIPDWI